METEQHFVSFPNLTILAYIGSTAYIGTKLAVKISSDLISISARTVLEEV